MSTPILRPHVKRFSKVIVVTLYVGLSPIWGPAAEGAFHLTPATPGFKGIAAIDVTGLVTAPVEKCPESLCPKPRPTVQRRSYGGSLPPSRVIACESKGSYTAENPYSTASGKYQIVDGTWGGHGGYSHASDAPPHIQDEKAASLWAGGRGASHWKQCL